jgi:hypothetical protein
MFRGLGDFLRIGGRARPALHQIGTPDVAKKSFSPERFMGY